MTDQKDTKQQDNTAVLPTDEETKSNIKDRNAANAKNQRIAAAARQKDEAPEEIMKHLSKRNADYIFKLRKGLAATDLAADRQQAIIDEMLPNIIEAQHKGKPANVIYGSVSEYINKMLHAPVPAKQTPLWMSTLDMSLTFLAMFTLVYGLFGLFSPKMAQSATNGWLTLVMIALAAGLLMAYTSQWVNRKRKSSFWRMILVSIVAVFIMMIILSFIMLVPRQINFIIPPVPELIIAALAYGGHYLLKKHFKPLGYFRN